MARCKLASQSHLLYIPVNLESLFSRADFFDLSYCLISHLCQVDVEEHELGGFLKTATGLQIKGLSDDQGGQVGRIHQASLIRHVKNPKVEQIHRLIVQRARKHEPY